MPADIAIVDSRAVGHLERRWGGAEWGSMELIAGQNPWTIQLRYALVSLAIDWTDGGR
jgi:hypothetical protein